MTCEAVLQSEIPLMHEKIDFWYGHLVYHKVSTFLLRFVVVVTSLYTRAQVLFMSIMKL